MLIAEPGPGGGGFMDPMPPIRYPRFPTQPIFKPMPTPPGGWPINPIPAPIDPVTPLPILDPPFGSPGPGKRFGWPGWPGRRPWLPPTPTPSPWRGPQYVPPRGGERPGPTPIFDPTPDPTPWGTPPPTARPDYRNQPTYGNRGKAGGYYGPSLPQPKPVTPRGVLDDVMKLFGG